MRFAAIAQIDPYSDTLTPKDLYTMAQAKMQNEWDHTAYILMMLNNTTQKKQRKIEDFHPFRKKRVEHIGKKGELTGAPLRSFRKYCKNWKGDK